MLTPVIPAGCTYRLVYEGPVGVSGVNVQQTLDLRLIPKNVRVDPTFRDNWRIFVRQISLGVTAVSPFVEFLPLTGVPDLMVLTLTAMTPLDQVRIDAQFLQSAVR